MARIIEAKAEHKENTDFYKQLYADAQKIEATCSDVKQIEEMYIVISAFDIDNEYGIAGEVNNKLGMIYEAQGNSSIALHYYRIAREFGHAGAKKSARRIKLDKNLEILGIVGEGLVQMGEQIGQTDSSDIGNGDGDYSVPDAKGQSFEFWKNQYDRWERQAKSCYDGLTNTGVKTKKKGKDVGGSAAGSWGAGNYASMKKSLRNAQRAMREVRAKARKDGHNIPQSNYETINVSY